jgi:hypothetical protein
MIQDLSWFGIKWDQGPSSEEISEIEKKFDEKSQKNTTQKQRKLGKKSGDVNSTVLSLKNEKDLQRVKKEDSIKVLVSPAVCVSVSAELENSDFNSTQESCNENKTKKIKFENFEKSTDEKNSSADEKRNILIMKSKFHQERRRLFHGINVEPFLTVFCQSKRGVLYTAAWQRLVDLKLGEIRCIIS